MAYVITCDCGYVARGETEMSWWRISTGTSRRSTRTW